MVSNDLGDDGGSRRRTTAGDDVGDDVGDVDDGDDGGDDGGDDAGDNAGEGDGGDAGGEGGGLLTEDAMTAAVVAAAVAAVVAALLFVTSSFFLESWRQIYNSQRNTILPVYRVIICFHMGTRSTKKVEFPCALIVLYGNSTFLR